MYVTFDNDLETESNTGLAVELIVVEERDVEDEEANELIGRITDKRQPLSPVNYLIGYDACCNFDFLLSLLYQIKIHFETSVEAKKDSSNDFGRYAE